MVRSVRGRAGNIINHVPRKTSNTTMADPSLNKLSPSIRVPSFSDTPYEIEIEIEIEAETSGFEVFGRKYFIRRSGGSVLQRVSCWPRGPAGKGGTDSLKTVQAKRVAWTFAGETEAKGKGKENFAHISSSCCSVLSWTETPVSPSTSHKKSTTRSDFKQGDTTISLSSSPPPFQRQKNARRNRFPSKGNTSRRVPNKSQTTSLLVLS